MSSNREFYVREALPKANGYDPKQVYEQNGVEALRDGELFMLALDLPQEKITKVIQNQSLTDFLDLSRSEIAQLIGDSKTRQFLCGLELSRRLLDKDIGIMPLISCPADTIPFLSEIKDKNKEHFLCLYLNARNQVIHQEIISIGSLSASIVHPREVFLVAVQHSAASVVLAHNHPSLDVSPSKDDIELTRRLVNAGEIMGIDVLDHIIIGSNDFLSLKEKGLM